MPSKPRPTTAKRRAKIDAKLNSTAPSLSDPSQSFRIPPPTTSSKSGTDVHPYRRPPALELPNELLMEILSHYGPGPYLMTGREDRYATFDVHRQRTKVLRALAQTCKQWRVIFFPMVWEHFLIASSSDQDGAWYKILGETLIKESTLIVKNPDLAAHLRVMTVSVTRYSVERVLPALVAVIKASPNLHTLRIVHTHSKMTTMIRDAFKGQTFRQIRTLILPPVAHHILRCCPEARTIVWRGGYDETNVLLVALNQVCKKVEELRGGCFSDEKQVLRLVKVAPNLRSYTSASYFHTAGVAPLKHLAGLKNLSYFHLTVRSPSFAEARQSVPDLIPLIKDMKAAMSKVKAPRKVIVIDSTAGSNGYGEGRVEWGAWQHRIDIDGADE